MSMSYWSEWLVTEIDTFPMQMGFTYNNKRTFKSVFGGLLTSAIFIFIIIPYCFFQFRDIWNFKTSINSSVEKRGLISNPEKIYYDEQDFDYAIHVEYKGKNDTVKYNLYSYFSFEIATSESFFNGTGYQFKAEIRNISYCDSNAFKGDFNYANASEIIGKAFCPEDRKFMLQGGTATVNTTFSQMYINVNECNEQWLEKFQKGTKCAPIEEQQKHIGDIAFYITFMTQYFAGENKESPIQSDFKKYAFYSHGSTQDYSFVSISKNQAILKDHWLASFFGVQTKSYTTLEIINQGEKNYSPNNIASNFLGIIIGQGDKIEVKTRTAFNLIDAISNIGGFITGVKILFGLFFSTIQKFLYFQRMIKSLYYTEESDNHIKDNFSHSYFNCQNQEEISKEICDLKNKPKMSIHFCTYVTSFCCKSKNSKKQYNSAFYMLNDELNIVRMIQRMRMLDLFFKMTLKPHQLKFLKAKSKRTLILPTEEQTSKGYKIKLDLTDYQMQMQNKDTQLVTETSDRHSWRLQKPLKYYMTPHKPGYDIEDNPLQKQSLSKLTKKYLKKKKNQKLQKQPSQTYNTFFSEQNQLSRP